LNVGAPEGKAIPAPLVVNQSLVVSQLTHVKYIGMNIGVLVAKTSSFICISYVRVWI